MIVIAEKFEPPTMTRQSETDNKYLNENFVAKV